MAVVEAEEEDFSLRVGRRDRERGFAFVALAKAVIVVCVCVRVRLTVGEEEEEQGLRRTLLLLLLLLLLLCGVETDRSLKRSIFEGVAVTASASSPSSRCCSCCVCSSFSFSQSPPSPDAGAISFNLRFLEGEAGRASAAFSFPSTAVGGGVTPGLDVLAKLCMPTCPRCCCCRGRGG